ncbi:MAG TPA: hypothetical protein VNH20_08830 [Candidatus Dormibacteraeota bacterium]|nr:hypothetical protein [Candidatus Dormibacteraeota bacterium]
MNFGPFHFPSILGRAAGAATLALAGALVMAACGSTPSASNSPSPSYSSPTSTSSPTGGVAVKTASVGSLGSVLVDGQGRTLYTLTSETGGHLTCTVANGCTQVWIELTVPSGVSAARASSGARASLLGTETGATGTVVTYKEWPLYTFSGDSGANQSHGQGLKSFGGTWYVVNAAGSLVESSGTSSPASSPGGYSYGALIP